MYRHQAVELLRQKQQQAGASGEIMPWMVDAVLSADRMAHEEMGVDTTPDPNQGEMFERPDDVEKSHPECRRCMQECGLV